MRAASRRPNDGRGWSPATFADDRRKKDNAEWVFAVGLDFDRDGDPHRVAAALGRFSGLVHTTKSHTASKPRCRAIVWLSVPVSAGRYESVYRALVATLPADLAAGLDVGASKDRARLWFLPSTDGDEREGVVLELAGEPLDPTTISDLPTAPERPAPTFAEGERPEPSVDRHAAHQIGTWQRRPARARAAE